MNSKKSYDEKRRLCVNKYYLAPENSFTQESDIWALGILLHEILTGYLPFNQMTL